MPTGRPGRLQTTIGARVHRVFAWLRLALAAVGVVALVFDLDYTLGFSTFSTVNYFLYFTFQSNLVNIGVLIASSLLALRRPGRGGAVFSTFRGIVTTYVIVSGIVFGTIVSQASSHQYRIEVPWSSQLLHFWIPSLLILDWIVGVGRPRLLWRTVPISLGFPIVWGVFTLIRGSIVGWYPYFFLDPDQVTPLEFAFYSGIALALFAGITALLVWVSRWRPVLPRRPRVPASPARPARTRRR
ncbi:Pr6Pr family membrane protein [Herbiconiux sp. P18]|uniref:Pr6Pr family membrane protein n=1 Tax=Herbiconiux liangxiaofengii TaxID=3342795 RepID=UPI003CE80FED